MYTTLIIDHPGRLRALRDLCRWATTIDLAYAWSTAKKGHSSHWRALDLAKVRRATIGTQGALTEPWVLSELAKLGEERDRLKVIINTSGTFHPKVIVGRNGGEVRALVGSANFTYAGYHQNTELDVLLEGNARETGIRRLLAFLDAQWEIGVPLRDSWLARYELAWEKAKRRRVEVPDAPLEVEAASDLALTWRQFVDRINAQEGRPVGPDFHVHVRRGTPSYYQELDAAERVFALRKPFAKLSREDRQLMIGVGPKSSGLIGSMRIAGNAKKIINEHPERIGRALDRIPLRGKVSLELAGEVVAAMTRLHGVNLGVASRLLTVKRPDLFVSLNKASQAGLNPLLQDRPITTPERYVELLRKVWELPWHRSPEPKTKGERRLWRRRAAILDAMLYRRVARSPTR